MGNGRATVLRFTQEGAKVFAVDCNLASAEETAAMAQESGKGECVAFRADVTSEQMLKEVMVAAHERWGRIDILHYNVGLSISGILTFIFAVPGGLLVTKLLNKLKSPRANG